MTAIAYLADSSVIHSLGWALLHFVWQGLIVALILLCGQRVIPPQASRLRYAIACGALALMVLLPVFTFFLLDTNATLQPKGHSIEVLAEELSRSVSSRVEQSPGLLTVRVDGILNQVLPLVTCFWMAGVLVLLCRLCLGLRTTVEWKSRASRSMSETQHVLRSLRARMGIQQPVQLLDSAQVPGPVVIGWLQPAILLPFGCMTGLSALQIEAILAHELAHIRRHDYLVNLLQSAVEIALFYHPAVWWVSNQIRCEREVCCDDQAVAICGDRLAYARALSFLETRRGSVPVGASTVTGGDLKMRITRLLRVHQPPMFSGAAAAILLMVATTAAGFTVWGSVQGQPTRSQGAAPAGQKQDTPNASSADPLVHVRALAIESNDLPSSERVQIVRTFQGTTYPIEELTQRIRRDLQDGGYARASVKLVQPFPLPSGKPPQSLNVLVRASAGIRYTLSDISVEGEHILSRDVVLRLFPIRPGDQFNATAIGTGLGQLRDLYLAKGYREFTAVPDLHTDDVHHLASVSIAVNEGKATAP